MINVQARGWDNFLYVTGLMDEAGVPWKTGGANVLRLPDDVWDRLTHEQLVEVAGAVSSPVPAAAEMSEPVAPPGAGDDANGPDPAVPAAGELPPRSGPGSSRDAWVAAAVARGLTVAADTTRDDIIDMIEQQEAPDAG